MSKPSVFKQVQAISILKDRLKDSPRHWNPGLIRHRGRLWMCYRYHLMSSSARCKTAICPIDERTLQPNGPSQLVDLPEPDMTVHQEDARLFHFAGQVYISYTEMVGYRPGVDFRCVMKYARLELSGNKWRARECWHPLYGRNDGSSKEKNWVFFDHDGRIHAVYCMDGRHTVLVLEGGRVVNEYSAPAPAWEWGIARGGTPPILVGGEYLCVFHSSIPTEIPPHYVRYFAGAYTFEAKPPFRVTGISPRPIMAGSEEDGHKVDPRYTAGWKPYVVFPCGLVPAEDKKYLVSFGINDWASAIARLDSSKLTFVAPDGSQQSARYFTTDNGSRPIVIGSPRDRLRYLHWSVPRSGAGCSSGTGYMKVVSARDAEDVSEKAGIREITGEEFMRENRPAENASLIRG